MTLFDELKQKFGPPMQVKPWGLCVVIQGTEFDPDWEAGLGDLGYNCHFERLDGHPAVFVPLRKLVAPGKSVYVPPAVSKEVPVDEVKTMDKQEENSKVKRVIRGVSWETVEDDLLVSLWLEKPELSIAKLVGRFQEKYSKRSVSSIANRVSILQHAPFERIKPRFTVNRSDKKKVEEEKKPVKVDGADVLVDLVKNYQVLSEGLESLRKLIVDTRTQSVELMEDVKATGDMVGDCQKFDVEINAKVVALWAEFLSHKHADKTGEAMVPPSREAS